MVTGRPRIPDAERAEVDLRLKLPPETYAYLCRIAVRYDVHVNVVARKMIMREAARLREPATSQSAQPPVSRRA